MGSRFFLSNISTSQAGNGRQTAKEQRKDDHTAREIITNSIPTTPHVCFITFFARMSLSRMYRFESCRYDQGSASCCDEKEALSKEERGTASIEYDDLHAAL